MLLTVCLMLKCRRYGERCVVASDDVVMLCSVGLVGVLDPWLLVH